MITPSLRSELKQPFGKLVRDSDVSKETFESEISKAKISVSVGDRTTERIHEFGLRPNLEVVDYLEKRSRRTIPEYGLSRRQIFRAVNEPGTINEDALERLSICLEEINRKEFSTLRLVVNGEEDLLVLPIAAFYPNETVIFYGQPNEGLVIVRSSQAKERATDMLAQIGITHLY